MDFTTLGLSQPLVHALSVKEIKEPSEVQGLAIPTIMDGKNSLVQAQTGSGKTLTYLLPIYQMLSQNLSKGNQVMVVVPTRELAMQVHQEVQFLTKNSGIPILSVTLFGDVNINTQMERLKAKPQIVIGTCDRMLALIQRKKVAAHAVKMFVVDEADKLLDKQSIESLKAVRKTCMKFTQTVFVSATYTPQNIKDATEMAPECEIIQTSAKPEIPKTITHQHLICERRDKLDYLRRLLRILNPEKSLIFINDLMDIDMAVEKLKYHGVECACIHSESSKADRQKHLTAFKDGTLKHLVSTDLAARGLHIDDIPYIFHVNIAEDPTDYLHRSGRTGRNGAAGYSISIMTQAEKQNLSKYRSKYGVQSQEIITRENKIIVK